MASGQFRAFGLVVAVWLAAASSALAADLEFKLLGDQMKGGQVQVLHGKPPPKLSDWRTILVANIDPAGHRRCTAALVGFRAVLTAAHCLKTADAVILKPKLRIEGVPYDMECEPHPDYPINADYLGDTPLSRADYALCWLGVGAVPPNALADVEYEVIDVAAPAAGEAIVLNGYGCTGMTPLPDGGISVTVDTKAFNVADATIDAITAALGVSAESYSPAGTKPALCRGDSGGPALSKTQTSKPRRVRGVNSSVWSDWDGPTFRYVSSIAPVGANDFAGWAQGWLDRHKTGPMTAWICGLSPDHAGGTAGCRD